MAYKSAVWFADRIRHCLNRPEYWHAETAGADFYTIPS